MRLLEERTTNQRERSPTDLEVTEQSKVTSQSK